MARHRREDQSFWISYSDLASGLMIAFLLVMLIMVAISRHHTEMRRERVKELVDRVQVILGTRARLADALEPAVGRLTGSIDVDPVTAQLVLDESVVTFKMNEHALTSDAKDFLNGFTLEYIGALWSHENGEGGKRLDPTRPQGVRRILVTGHADLVGESDSNHFLSARRAEEVVQYMRYVLRCAANVQHHGKTYNIDCTSDIEEARNRLVRQQDRIHEDDLAALWSYGQERLYAVGAGDLEHCRALLSAGPYENASASRICYEKSNIKEEVTDNPDQRKVTFELDITGSDMTGLLVDVLELRRAVEQEEPSEEGGGDGGPNEIDELARSVARRCWQEPGHYHGCQEFVRLCLSREPEEDRTAVGGIDCAGFESRREQGELADMVRNVCEQEKESGSRTGMPGCRSLGE